MSHPKHSAAACLLLSLSAAMTLLATAGCSDQKHQAEQLVRSATAQARSGEHADAVRTFAQALALNTRLPEAHYGRGLSQSALGQHAAAIDSFQTAARLRPAWPELWLALATAQRASGEHALAVRSLDEAIRLKPEFTAALYDRACAWLKLQNPAAALTDLDAVIARNPRHLDARLQRGRCVWNSSPEQAIEDLTLVLESDKHRTEALHLRGMALGRAARVEEALTDLNEACQLQPQNPAVWLARGRVLRFAARFPEAAADLKLATSLSPEDPDILCELALIARDSGQTDLAQQLLRQTLKAEPGHMAARLAIADALAAQSNFSAALLELQNILAEPNIGLPANSALLIDVRLRRTSWLYDAGRLDEALAEARSFLQTEPHNEQARLLHARILQQLQRHEEAVADLTRLISIRQTDSDALLARAVSNHALDQHAAALQDLNDLLQHTPNAVPALALRARIQAAAGQTESALTDIDAAIAAAADNDRAPLQIERLQILNQLGHSDAADNARQQLADAAFANLEKLRMLLAELERSGRHADSIELLSRAARQFPEPLPHDLILLHARLIAAEQPTEAAQLLNTVPPEEQPADVRSEVAAAFNRSNRFADAEKLLDPLVAENPGSDQLHALRLHARIGLNAWNRAAEDAEFILASQPRHPDALLTKAIHLAAAGQLAAATEHLQIPAALPTPRPETLWTLAQCQTALGRREAARETITRLLLVEPNHNQARLLRVRLAIELNDLDDAAADLHQLMQHQPDQPEALLLHGTLMLKLNRSIDALRSLTRLLQTENDNVAALELRAHALHELGRSRDASIDLERALKLQPKSVSALLLLASVTATLGYDVDALRLYDQAIAIQPHSFRAWHNRGSLLYKNGRFDQAVSSWKRALICQPSETRTRINLAAALRKLNDDTAALAEYQTALRQEPDSIDAAVHLASLLASSRNAEVRNPAAAEKLARSLCERTQFKHPLCLQTLADSCRANNQLAEASRWNSLARKLSPQTNPAPSAAPNPNIRTAEAPAKTNTSKN